MCPCGGGGQPLFASPACVCVVCVCLCVSVCVCEIHSAHSCVGSQRRRMRKSPCRCRTAPHRTALPPPPLCCSREGILSIRLELRVISPRTSPPPPMRCVTSSHQTLPDSTWWCCWCPSVRWISICCDCSGTTPPPPPPPHTHTHTPSHPVIREEGPPYVKVVTFSKSCLLRYFPFGVREKAKRSKRNLIRASTNNGLHGVLVTLLKIAKPSCQVPALIFFNSLIEWIIWGSRQLMKTRQCEDLNLG